MIGGLFFRKWHHQEHASTRTGKDNRSYDCLILKSFERMDVPANGWASRSNGWTFLSNGWVSRSNGWTFLSNGWASRSNGWMLLPNGWASHSNGWTFLSNRWSSRSNGCKFFWTNANFFQTGSKQNSVRKRKAVMARFRVKGHSFSRLNFNPGFFFFYSKVFSRKIFGSSNHHIVHKKEFNWICFSTFGLSPLWLSPELTRAFNNQAKKFKRNPNG